MTPYHLHKRGLSVALVFGALTFSVALHTVHAEPIDLSIINPMRIGAPGEVETFQGTITNNTGAALDSTDLFLNFSGYDPANVTLDQLLGLTSFSIPDGVMSGVVDLFTFSLANTAVVPATYPADVVLESSDGDVAPTQTVSVSTGVNTIPEPGSLALTAMALLALFLGALRRRIKLVLPILAIITIAPTLATAQVSPVQFVTGRPGLAMQGQTLLVVLPITNNGILNATNVQVTGVTLRTAPLVSPSSFPVVLGVIAPDNGAVFQASFNAASLAPNTPYLLTVRGTYQASNATAGFTVNRFISLPPATPGSAPLKTTRITSNFVSGAPFPPQPPGPEEKLNQPGAPVPTVSFVQGTPTPSSTAAQIVPNTTNLPSGLAGGAANTIVFLNNNGVGTDSGGRLFAEPSGASGDGVVFLSAGLRAAYSTDGGDLFTQLDPTTIFPGFCCDQLVQYAPSIDRFIWLIQSDANKGYQLVSISPADIKSGKPITCTYWTLTLDLFGQPDTVTFDYPDLSVGDNYLYMSWDADPRGLLVARTSLAGLQAGGTIEIDFTDPSDSSLARASHLSQNTRDEIFWAGHNGNSQLRVFSLAEGSSRYFWRDRDISPYPNDLSTISSITPDNQDWLSFGHGFPGDAVIGATRSSNQIWFAWTAGTKFFAQPVSVDSSFEQPHVELVTLDRTSDFSVIQQGQIWNNNYAFAYPALATNSCTGEIGLSLLYGGNGNYENHVVGFWGDFVVYITTNSNVGTDRNGDFVTIRRNPTLGFFDAFGYGLNSVPPPGSGTQTDVRYVVFGRAEACPDVVKIDAATLTGFKAQGMEFHVLSASATSSAFPEAQLQVTVPGCIVDAAMHPDPERNSYVLTGTRVFCPLFSSPGVPLKYTATVTSNFHGSASAPVKVFGE
jgi:hypothetical protein